MRLRVLVAALAFLAIGETAEAEETIRFGPVLGFPVAAGDIGDHELGVDAGVTVDLMKRRNVGIGLDVVYHHWPASRGYQAEYDRFLRSWFQTFDSPTWSLRALQTSAHVKFLAPSVRHHTPWLQIGGGFYRLDRNLAEPDWEGSVAQLLIETPGRTSFVPGWSAAVGVDSRISANASVGVHATFHRVLEDDEPTVWGTPMKIPGFSVLTIGANVLFGRRP